MSNFDPMASPPPQDASSDSWPPPPVGQPQHDTLVLQNTSGMNSTVPPEISQYRWNWGAFILSVFWAFANKVQPYGWVLLVATALCLVPYIGRLFVLLVLGIPIYLAINGHSLAWQNRRFDGGVPDFLAVQTAWSRWSIGVVVVCFLLTPVYALILLTLV